MANNERAGQIPFEWRLAEDKNTLIPHEKEQEVIRLARELQGQGESYRSICEALMKAGHNPKGKYWHPQTIKNILKNNQSS